MAHVIVHELVASWPFVFVSDLLRYGLAAGGLVAVLYILRRLLEHRRIQNRRAGMDDVRREIGHSLLTVVIFSFVGASVHVGGTLGLFRVDIFATPSLGTALADIAIMIVAHDAYFYWAHRAMHHPRLFRGFHRLHHRSRTPTPWAAYSFAPLEALVEAAFLPLFLLVYPATGLVVFVFVIHMVVRNVIGHAGIELFPKNWLRWPLLRAFTTTTHHDLHHAEVRWNYGLYFTWWDRLMGTEHPDYRKRFAKTTRSQLASSPTRSNRALLILLILGVGAVASGRALAFGSEASAVQGRWITPDFSAIVEVALDADTHGGIRGTVIWILDEARQDVVGTSLFRDMRRGATGWTGGRIYNPENARTYRGQIRIDQSPARSVLVVRGCLGPFCQTQRWRRLDEVLASMPKGGAPRVAGREP